MYATFSRQRRISGRWSSWAIPAAARAGATLTTAEHGEYSTFFDEVLKPPSLCLDRLDHFTLGLSIASATP
jgi:hypothetical protein